MSSLEIDLARHALVHALDLPGVTKIQKSNILTLFLNPKSYSSFHFLFHYP